MKKNQLIGTWKLKSFTIGKESDHEQWEKDGILLFTSEDHFSISVNYLGNISKDREKKYTSKVIRDYFGAGEYKVLDGPRIEFLHKNHSMPERVNFKETRKVNLNQNLLHEIINRGDLEIHVTWEKQS